MAIVQAFAPPGPRFGAKFRWKPSNAGISVAGTESGGSMKIWSLAALAVLLTVSACETLGESYAIERDDLLNEDGIHVYSDLMENAWDGARYWQFRAVNYSEYPFCVRVGLASVSYSNGYDMGHVHYLAPGASRDIGYVHAPADFRVEARAWDPDENGGC